MILPLPLRSVLLTLAALLVAASVALAQGALLVGDLDKAKRYTADVGPVPVVISTASMQRYGGSSTPTFVFIDRAGIVRRYTPTRLAEAELEREWEELLR